MRQKLLVFEAMDVKDSATLPDLLNIFFWILKAFENCNDFPIKVYFQYINDRDHQDKNNHKNQTKNDKDLKNSLKWPQHMEVKAQELLGPLLI